MNNQFIHLQGKVYKRYIKASLGILSGWRVDPGNVSQRMPYILETPEKNVSYIQDEDYVKADKRLSVDYDKEILEVYSEEEDKLFRRLNRTNIENGLIIEYLEELGTIDTTNELTDQTLKGIADTKNLLQFKKRIAEITSPITLKRILDMLDDRPKSFTTALELRMKDVTI